MTIIFKISSNFSLFHFFIFFLTIFMWKSLASKTLNKFLFLTIWVYITIILITMAVYLRCSNSDILVKDTWVIFRKVNFLYIYRFVKAVYLIYTNIFILEIFYNLSLLLILFNISCNFIENIITLFLNFNIIFLFLRFIFN